eukprot:TRINITY_DN482_c0_g1_i1.p1 TRINITY_DN482_c0_g1~~TRINITY_DN482_c0_g1_i1.p1  ORF type:complete len:252 (-),score=56.85 TRINITY_DN482_c0_g1_i1:107-862(-)
MKISHFCWGPELKRAVNFLAIYGMVMSVIGAMGAVFLFILPMLFGMTGVAGLAGIYTGATVLLLVKFGWFVFSFKLHQKNTAEDFAGVKKIIKIGNYIIGSVQAGFFALLLIFGIIFITFGPGYNIMGYIMMPLGGFFLVFPSLLLDGIRRKHSGKVKAWIVFKLVFLGLFLAMCMVKLFIAGQVLSTIIQLIMFTLGFMYCSGMVIVHYNILLDDENVLESALENFSNKGYYLDNQQQIKDDPPAYSQTV